MFFAYDLRLKGRRTRTDKLKLSVQYCIFSVQKSVVFNATAKSHSVRVITILYLKIRYIFCKSYVFFNRFGHMGRI